MGLLSRDIKTMDDLFVHTLQDIYYAENHITKALPQMIDKASDPQLKQAFQTHLEETCNQIKRLEQVFQQHGAEAKGVDCPAIDGITEEAEEIMGEVEDPEVLDAAILAAAQAVEHAGEAIAQTFEHASTLLQRRQTQKRRRAKPRRPARARGASTLTRERERCT